MGNFVVSTTLESLITIVKCFIRLTTDWAMQVMQLYFTNQCTLLQSRVVSYTTMTFVDSIVFRPETILPFFASLV